MLYEIIGTVVRGKQLGRTIGFPTANVQPDTQKDIPYGVYAGECLWDTEIKPCVVNIGRHPTVPEGAPTIEAHILDFHGDLYGQTITLRLNRFLRPERRFESLDALREQLQRDIEQVG